MKLLASAAFIAAIGMASAANAVIAPFGGPATGTDPLGHTWQANNSAGVGAWGEPGLGSGELTFNPLGVNNSAGTWANRFSFIFLEGVAGAINQTPAFETCCFDTTTRFVDATTGQLWTTQFVGPNKVVFTAPSGSKISMGDQFFVNVVFTGLVDTARFSFAGLWTDAAVPEPATWALMIGGFGLAGMALRRRKTVAA